MRLPDWNDLTNEQRSGICRKAEYHACSCMDAGQLALDVYEILRETLNRPEADPSDEPLELPRHMQGPTYNGRVA
jgi:hypothetical protein